jgi:hypothetical protein
MLKVLNYLLLSICHSVGKISTMYKIVVDKASEYTLILNIPHHIKHLTPSY